jgi:hypothetical protein
VKVKPVLLRREVVKGRAYAVADADNPHAGNLAAAMVGSNGWEVAAAGAVVASGLTQRKAVKVMMRAAAERVERPVSARRTPTVTPEAPGW